MLSLNNFHSRKAVKMASKFTYFIEYQRIVLDFRFTLYIK